MLAAPPFPTSSHLLPRAKSRTSPHPAYHNQGRKGDGVLEKGPPVCCTTQRVCAPAPAGQGCIPAPQNLAGPSGRRCAHALRPAYCTKKPIWQDRGDPTRRCPPEVALAGFAAGGHVAGGPLGVLRGTEGHNPASPPAAGSPPPGWSSAGRTLRAHQSRAAPAGCCASTCSHPHTPQVMRAAAGSARGASDRTQHHEKLCCHTSTTDGSR